MYQKRSFCSSLFIFFGIYTKKYIPKRMYQKSISQKSVYQNVYTKNIPTSDEIDHNTIFRSSPTPVVSSIQSGLSVRTKA